ncbi:MAG: polymerase [Clostridia bacterium]|jgi:DNA polymerase-1|nr:polymerase [Clostridia bacterium]
MEIKINLPQEDEREKEQRVKDAQRKAAKYIPTWGEIWEKGYKSHTGTEKKAILKTKLSDLDSERLIAVKEAVEKGEMGTYVESLDKFTKTHALKLYATLRELRKEATIAKMIAEKPDNYRLIVEEQDFCEILNLLNYEDEIGFDTETTGVNFDNDYTVGMSMTLPKADVHCYIPYGHTTGEKQLSKGFVFKKIKSHLENRRLKKILHNAKFDAHILRNDGVILRGIHFDTMVGMTLLNENEMSYALKKLATKYGKHFGFDDKSSTYEELFGRGGFEGTPLDIGHIYACKDTHLCYQFYKWQLDQMHRVPQLKRLYFDIEQKITNVCIEMEKNGFLIDQNYAKTYGDKLTKEVRELESKLLYYFGSININSNQQLAEKLYDELGLPDVSNKRSVDADTLEILKTKHNGIATLLKYRELNKLLSTYIDPLPLKVHKRDRRLHGQFNQTATVTGRFASREPNLQNLPYDARKIIIAPDGKLIIGIDYSQIEPRVLAHISGDEELRYPYKDGKDLYATLASKVFKKPIEECGDGSKYRKMMKTGLLAVMYGTSNFTLAGQLDITVEEADEFIADFYESYPKVKEFIDTTNKMADNIGYVETLYGRKRRFIGHKNTVQRYRAVSEKVEKALGKVLEGSVWKTKLPFALKREYGDIAKDYNRVARQSVNAVIQGSSADIMKLAMIGVCEWLEKKGDEWKLLATVHDEILIEVPETVAAEEIAEIEHIMMNTIPLEVPYKVDTEVSIRWGEGIPKRTWLENGAGRRAFELVA